MKSTALRILEIPGFLLLGVLAAFLAFEIFPDNLTRGGYWPGPYCRPDPLTGYRFLGGDRVCSKLFDFRCRLRIGPDGFRCTHPLDRPSGAPVRVIVLGHSQAFCAGCGEEDALHGRLEEALRERHGIAATCYNLALPGSDLLTDLAVLETFGPALEPTHVFHWGAGRTHVGLHEQRIRRLENRIVAGYAVRRVPGIPKTPWLGRTGLLRVCLGAPAWETLGKRRVVPKAVRDTAGSVGLWADGEKTAGPLLPPLGALRRRSELAACARRLGATFLPFDADGLPPLRPYPTDVHATPANIRDLAEALADLIAGGTP
jgi:hypothetical protein